MTPDVRVYISISFTGRVAEQREPGFPHLKDSRSPGRVCFEPHQHSSPQLRCGHTVMASIICRVQYLEDSDPFICTNFPEPRRPPTVSLEESLPLSEQIAGIHKLLEAPLKVGPCRTGPHITTLNLFVQNVQNKTR